ncbi:hypothetical protein G7B40_027220 [Aetokthonos hydrillicola Thurmond2011]|uniref:Uncharacterized protein n=1 Tax=Aetokthonos hydrillicola Thurmond2011 TaxID=2712845 RepID=A0AAP5IB27_9CYAN|nr:hypothetical protein [Aetokthonos hydrillicola]MBO3463441.1 hypothetical protein [Aetokthonos hydrillicola CCALA 1050]MBW4588950.1 hypothetical protein [Aetokthonos hydrillicola CCALA 1050]MDR9898223.1 hypothetical protein [Aetokthonos hydrillicola Thurmond2011]
MLNKTVVFGLIAAGLMIAPTAAFAGSSQSQGNVQTTQQNGAATNGSTNAQSSDSVNVQKQISNIKSRTHGVGTPGASQSQSSDQATGQNGAADNGSVNAQTSSTVSNQVQNSNIRKNRLHR